jgi:hypothetical protein
VKLSTCNDPYPSLRLIPVLQDIQASELQHAELEESAAARHKQQEEDRQRAADAQREKDVLEAAVAAAERRLQVLQQQAQVRGGCRLKRGDEVLQYACVGCHVHVEMGHKDDAFCVR